MVFLMNHFALYIETGNKKVKFEFTKVVGYTSVKYFVTAADGADTPVNFEMKESMPGYWTVLAPAPEWIRVLQNELGNAINTKLRVAPSDGP